MSLYIIVHVSAYLLNKNPANFKKDACNKRITALDTLCEGYGL